MSPGGYRRGAAELGVSPASGIPRSVLLALLFLAVAQVGCTLGLFLYFRAQAVQEVIADKQLHTGDAVMEASHARKKSKQETRSIAHLTISNHTWGPQSKVNLAFWNYKEGWANILNMSYNDGKLKVLQDGFYYVYANICFRHHENSGNVFLHKSLQLMMYICKSNPKRTQNETLMKGGSTKYWSNNSVYHFYSVYQGGVFKLLAGEEILIKVSYPALLDPAQEATYFGAFKILDQEL
ncbi:tumor necrosis factor ligand superfamily member 11 isoform X3 [Ascaphus truei]|uniref:tumor necrosis factor ligand superfamily member 11 isoform X3 n=1 Tax=Ascaphus truei TaxID=8439 RepID=UPI003F5ACE14